MKLIYIYHSGFAIVGDDITIILDYWKDPAGVIPGLLRNKGSIYVMASHFHPDHFVPEILKWKEMRPDIKYILSKDILRHHRAQKEDALFMAKGAVYKDDKISVQAFGSTDIGVSWYIETEGKRIFHAGDLNNWHWADECTKEESMKFEMAYLGELKDICKVVKVLDLAMFPVDIRLGGEYMRGPRQFIDSVPTKLFAPMHFSANPNKMANAFEPVCRERNVDFFCINKEGDSIDF